MGFEIQLADLEREDVRALLAAHLAFAFQESPRESVHALDVTGLRAPDITLWEAREDGQVVATGALRQLDAGHGEIKSMHTRAAARGRGYGARMLEHLLAEARRRGYRRVSLETGTAPAYAAARALYTRAGFEVCPPFGAYRDDGASVCMTMELASGGAAQGAGGQLG